MSPRSPEERAVIDTQDRRPRLHFTADSGWINDPLGLTWHDGRYHLFYQCLPDDVRWNPACRWGHAVGTDLLTWEQRPVVLEPDADEDGCWSGSLVVADGQATIFYTAVDREDISLGRIRTAHPADDTWDSWAKGPVVARHPGGLDVTTFRDPYVWGGPGEWRMLVGAGRGDAMATALVHASVDLVTWTYLGELASRPGSETEPVWTGSVWECPQLVRTPDADVLLVSAWEPWVSYYEACALGTLKDDRFVPRSWQRLTFGDCYYAGSTFRDAAGRQAMIYWLRGVDDRDGRWAGALSIPQLLVVTDGRLLVGPHPDVAQRRGAAVPVADGGAPLPAVADIEWTAPHGALSVDSPLHGRTLHVVAGEHGTAVQAGDRSAILPPATSLRLIVDGQILEIFGGEWTYAAPVAVDPDATVSVTGGAAAVYDLG